MPTFRLSWQGSDIHVDKITISQVITPDQPSFGSVIRVHQEVCARKIASLYVHGDDLCHPG